MLKKKHLKGKPVCRVTFEVPKTVDATTAHLVGDFNDWDTAATPMKQLKDGRFTVTLDLPTGRAYQFRYLLDGAAWENDSGADRYVANPYGGDNSVVIT